ncbi:MAG: three-Cys-motif partner protein TcmP [Gemmatimonadota bacterium]
MTGRRRPRRDDSSHPAIGGDWTDRKLEVLAKYLSSYTTALKDQPTASSPFIKGYIDAFAGTGYRTPREKSNSTVPLFPDLAAPEPQRLLEGSARLALKSKPPFDRCIFIERSADRCTELEGLKSEFPALSNAITVRRGEANAAVRALCSKDWRAHRAVLFLDAFGMQVEWETLVAVAKTKAIDLWLLFPLGMGVNRLLTRSGDIPDSWRRRLDILLGTTGWYDELYRSESSTDLFGEQSERLLKATTDTIGRYFIQRLKTIFAGVSAKPGVLRNSTNNPLYLLCFAVGNPRGSGVALRIADHLLKELH